ncbi:MAG TPA: 5-(carboxyamino)imidazole ribonucleotide mutase [Gemmatimonadota bacterium]|jgi:phosphoribosylaminoimidazole carboxylase PurE protein|nr:5-(carboxyamino)imidazole ribonucleotide mutase [Gemmatimonadota bacterium]
MSTRKKKAEGTARVLIVAGSESDRTVIEKAEKVLREAGVGYRVEVASAHRTPERVAELARGAEAAGYRVVIAAAGLAAALPGVVAAHTSLPVIGLPVGAGPLRGIDALLAIAMMPPGVPVATVGIDNGANAAHLALRILGRAAG